MKLDNVVLKNFFEKMGIGPLKCHGPNTIVNLNDIKFNDDMVNSSSAATLDIG